MQQQQHPSEIQKVAPPNAADYFRRASEQPQSTLALPVPPEVQVARYDYLGKVDTNRTNLSIASLPYSPAALVQRQQQQQVQAQVQIDWVKVLKVLAAAVGVITAVALLARALGGGKSKR